MNERLQQKGINPRIARKIAIDEVRCVVLVDAQALGQPKRALAINDAKVHGFRPPPHFRRDLLQRNAVHFAGNLRVDIAIFGKRLPQPRGIVALLDARCKRRERVLRAERLRVRRERRERLAQIFRERPRAAARCIDQRAGEAVPARLEAVVAVREVEVRRHGDGSLVP